MIPTASAAIEKHGMLERGDKIILGLSGGADSVCLLHLLLSLQAKYSLELSAVHVNHGIRGDEALADEGFVRELCRGLGVELDVYSYDIPGESARMGLTAEEAGRVLRYRSFEQSRVKRLADKIAVAHNKNDNVETILMRIFRGTGMKGLGGIPPVRGSIIRPLIETTRDEIECFCRSNNIRYRTDSTNLKNIYTRNFIRLELLPLVENRLTPAAADNVLRMSQILSEEDAFLDALAMDALKASETAAPGLSIPALLGYPDALKRRILRLFFRSYTVDNHDIACEHINMALRLCAKQTGKRVYLPLGIVLERRYDELVLVMPNAQTRDFCYALPPDTDVFIKECGLSMRASLKKPDFNSDNICTKTFSCDRITGALQVRNRRPGDKIFVASMGGNKKLKDYFIDAKIPRGERDLIPLVTCGGDVIWIADQKNIVSDTHKAAADTRDKLYIQTWVGHGTQP